MWENGAMFQINTAMWQQNNDNDNVPAYNTYSSAIMSVLFPVFVLNDSSKKLVPWGTDGRLPLSDLDLDLGSGHTVYRRASLIDLYLRTKFH